MPWLQYVGPFDRFSCPRWGIGDHPATEPVEVTQEAYDDLVQQELVYQPAKAPKRAAGATPLEG